MRLSLSKNLHLRKPPKTPNPDDTETMSQGSTVSANGVAVATVSAGLSIAFWVAQDLMPRGSSHMASSFYPNLSMNFDS